MALYTEDFRTFGVGVDISFSCHLDQAAVCRIAFRGDRPILQTFNETAPLPNP